MNKSIKHGFVILNTINPARTSFLSRIEKQQKDKRIKQKDKLW